jgi:hypothetical protein
MRHAQLSVLLKIPLLHKCDCSATSSTKTVACLKRKDHKSFRKRCSDHDAKAALAQAEKTCMQKSMPCFTLRHRPLLDLSWCSLWTSLWTSRTTPRVCVDKNTFRQWQRATAKALLSKASVAGIDPSKRFLTRN